MHEASICGQELETGEPPHNQNTADGSPAMPPGAPAIHHHCSRAPDQRNQSEGNQGPWEHVLLSPLVIEGKGQFHREFTDSARN